MGGDQTSLPPSLSVSAAPKSSSRIAMCGTIANRRRRYQCLAEGVENDVSPPHHRVTERFPIATSRPRKPVIKSWLLDINSVTNLWPSVTRMQGAGG